MLGMPDGTQVTLKTSHEKKPQLTNITFPQWSAANFRIMHTLVKESALSTVSDIMNYISYITKVSELAKIYPIVCVVHYDDLYRRMQFATGCKWSTESQLSNSNPFTNLTPTSLTQPNKQIALQADPRQLSAQQQASRCAMISNDDKAADIVQLANMIMFEYSQSAWGTTPNGSTQPLKTPKPELALTCRAISQLFSATTYRG